MKRVLTGVVATALVLSVGVTSAFAAGRGYGRNYVDANKDGLCDNYVVGVCPFRDADGDGVCDNCDSYKVSSSYEVSSLCQYGGHNFVDANGDGVCDNCGINGGTGVCQYGGHNFVDADGDGVCDNCNGGGRYYVDANGDGVCDNYASGGHGHGGGHGHCR